MNTTRQIVFALLIASSASAQLKYSPDSLYLVEKDGTPVFLNGTAPWDINNVNLSDAKRCLDSIASHGMNYCQIRAMSPALFGGIANAYGVNPWQGSQTFASTPTEAFWAHMDSLVGYAKTKHIYFMLYIDYLGGDGSAQGWAVQTASSSAAQMQAWGQYMGNRYKDSTNILWCASGDIAPTPWQTNLEAMITGLKSTGDTHLISTRDEPGTTTDTYWSTRPWVTLNGSYPFWATWDVNVLQSAAKDMRARSPRKPAGLQEAWYEGEHGVAQTQLRSQSYWMTLGGSIAFQIFGNCPLWDFSKSTAFCGAGDWNLELDSQGMRNQRIFARIVLGRKWYKLIPDTNHVVTTAGYGTWGGADYAVTSYTSDSSSVLCYMPSTRQVTVNTNYIKSGGSVAASWINPATGDSTYIGTFARSSATTFTPPAGSDFVLALDATLTSSPVPPPAPVPSAPPNGATGVTTSPTMTWNPSVGATSYRLQLSTDSTFATTIVDQSGVTATSYAASGLAISKKYFWHVNATNAAGTSAYSGPFNFTTSAAPTGLVAAYAFDEGAGTTVADKSGNNLTGTIVGATWTSGGKYGNALSFNGTTGYVDLGNPAQMQITGSMTVSAWVNAAANPPDDGQIVAKSNDASGWQLKTTPDTGPVTFGVAVSGSAGSHTQRYSTAVRSLNTWYYVAGVYDATAKTLSTYVNGVLNNGKLSGVVPASQVNLGVNVNVGRRSPGSYGGFYFNGIIDEVRIYNRALSQAEIQADMSTPLGSALLPPPAPVPATPANGSTGVATNPTLTWNASAGASSYRLQLSADSTFATTIVDQSGLTTTSYAATGLATGKKYFWHVNATNASGTSGYSTPFSFTTSAPPPPPSAPVLATPLNGATGLSVAPTLTWTPSTGAASYRLQISGDSTFASAIVDQSGLTTTTFTASGLATGTRYFWHVNAANTGGSSAYSASFSFTTIPTPTGLVAAYAFDEGTGTTVADKSGNNLTGTIVGATWTSGGKYGKALSFNGTTNYVDLGNPAQLQITGSMTVSAWVNAAASLPDDGQIIAKSNDASGWQLKTTSDTGPVTFGTAISGSSGSHTQRYSAAIRSLNTWYYVAGVYDVAARTLSIYVNGVLNNGTLSGTIPATQINLPVNVNIGRRSPGSYGGFYFNGIIDEVRVYNRALSQAEIQADMNTPLSAPAAQLAPTIVGVQAVAGSASVNVAWEGKPGTVSTILSPLAVQNGGAIASHGVVPKAGNTIDLKVSAVENGASSYQWQQDGVDISGATGPAYTARIGSSSPAVTRIRCIAWNQSGADTSSDAMISNRQVTDPAAAVEARRPVTYSLDQNYPNPFNPSATIMYAIPRAGFVTLAVFNLIGQQVATLVNEVQAPGSYQVVWNGRNSMDLPVTSGVYIYRLRSGSFTKTNRMVLLK